MVYIDILVNAHCYAWQYLPSPFIPLRIDISICRRCKTLIYTHIVYMYLFVWRHDVVSLCVCASRRLKSYTRQVNVVSLAVLTGSRVILHGTIQAPLPRPWPALYFPCAEKMNVSSMGALTVRAWYTIDGTAIELKWCVDPSASKTIFLRVE